MQQGCYSVVIYLLYDDDPHMIYYNEHIRNESNSNTSVDDYDTSVVAPYTNVDTILHQNGLLTLQARVPFSHCNY